MNNINNIVKGYSKIDLEKNYKDEKIYLKIIPIFSIKDKVI